MKKFLVVLAACGGGGQSPAPDAPTCGTPRTIFLNRGGGDYRPGQDDSSNNVSGILQDATTLAAPNVLDADWTFFVDCVSSKFAAFNAVVTDQDPGAIAHTEQVVIDRATQIGLMGGVSGVSPFGCGRGGGPELLERAITFLMWEGFSNGERCQVGAQVIANSFGLDHSLSCPDIMTFMTNCGAAEDKTFTDADAECGEFTARACNCGGTTQNSFQYLTETLGAFCE